MRDGDPRSEPTADRRLLVVATDETIADRARAALGADWQVLRCAPDESGVRTALRLERVDAVLVDVDEGGAFGERHLDVVARVAAAAAGVPVIVTTRATDSGETVRDAIRRGARDVCDTFVLEDELPASLDRTRRLGAAREPPPEGRGRLVAVTGALPGTGASTTALETCASLASRGGDRRVLLFDLSRPCSAAGSLFPEARRYGVDDAAGDIGRMDGSLVDSAFPRHAGTGIRYLGPGDRDLRDTAPPPGDLLTLVEIVRPFFDTTVVDADLSAAPRAARQLAAAADAVVLCVDQRVAGVQAADRLLQSFGDGVADRSDVILCVTRHDPGLAPSADDIARALQTGRPVTVRDLGRAPVLAHNLGRFAVAASRRHRTAYAALADAIEPAGQGVGRGRGALRRVLARHR